MKTINLKKNAQSIFTLFISAALLVSCSKSNNTTPASGSSHKIIYTATATNGAVINGVSYSDGSGQLINVGSLNTTTYTSPEITTSASQADILFNAQGQGTGASSTITATITVDGVVKETSTGSGVGISARVYHVF